MHKKPGQKGLIMKDTPINGLMENAISKIRDMVDVSTIIGEPFECEGVTLIPVSRVSYGFGSGGTDLPNRQSAEYFGGGGGAGISIIPVAFIVIQDGKVRMMQINNYTSSADRAISMIPELIDQVSQLVKEKDKDSESDKDAEKTEKTSEKKA